MHVNPVFPHGSLPFAVLLQMSQMFAGILTLSQVAMEANINGLRDMMSWKRSVDLEAAKHKSKYSVQMRIRMCIRSTFGDVG